MVSGTYVERELFESTAYLSLKGFAPQLLILILGKRTFLRQGKGKKKTYQCVNGTRISFTYKEAQLKYNLTIPRFTRAIDELMEKGFLKIDHQGGGSEGDQTIFSLSDDYLLWHPGKIIFKRECYFINHGFCKPKR